MSYGTMNLCGCLHGDDLWSVLGAKSHFLQRQTSGNAWRQGKKSKTSYGFCIHPTFASNLECTFRFLGCFHTRYDAQRETTFQLIQSQDPSSLIQSAHSLRFAPNDSTWRRCLLGYPWSRPQIGLRAPPVEQPEQLESERRLHHFPDSWFQTTCAEMRVRVMARKASVSKILPLLSVANCPIFERSGKSDDFWKM